MVSKRKIFQTDHFKSYYDNFHFITKQSIESIKVKVSVLNIESILLWYRERAFHLREEE